MPGVTGHVRRAGGVTRGTGGGASRIFIGIAGGSVGGECGLARWAASYLTARPGPRRFNRFARPVVFRTILLEVGKRAFRAISGPKRP